MCCKINKMQNILEIFLSVLGEQMCRDRVKESILCNLIKRQGEPSVNINWMPTTSTGHLRCKLVAFFRTRGNKNKDYIFLVWRGHHVVILFKSGNVSIIHFTLNHRFYYLLLRHSKCCLQQLPTRRFIRRMAKWTQTKINKRSLWNKVSSVIWLNAQSIHFDGC